MTIRGTVNSGVSDKGKAARQQLAAKKTAVAFQGINPIDVFKNLPPNPVSRLKFFSMEDLTNRTGLLGTYAVQGSQAIYYKQVPFETWIRNILVWFGGIGIAIMAKHPSYGTNTLFNQFMVPKKSLPGKVNSFQEAFFLLLNPFRPRKNYLEFAQQAGIKLGEFGIKGDVNSEASLKTMQEKAIWTMLDANEQEKLLNYAIRMEELGKTMLEKKNKGISKYCFETAKAIKSMKLRIMGVRALNVLVSGAIMTLITGIALQKLVFIIASPLDKKFFPKPRQRKKDLDTQAASHSKSTSPNKISNHPFQSTSQSRRSNG